MRAAEQSQRGGAHAIAHGKQRSVFDSAAAAGERAAVEADNAVGQVGGIELVHRHRAAVEREPAVTHVQCVVAHRVGGEYTTTRDSDDVAGRWTVADDHIGGYHCAAVGDGQRVERTRVADVKAAAVAPQRSRPAHHNSVGTSTIADIAVQVVHLPAVGDDELAAGAAVVADAQITLTVQSRAGVTDRQRVVACDKNAATDLQLPALSDRHLIAGSANIANLQSALVLVIYNPSRADTAHRYGVVVSTVWP